jgi:hypothetical protein
MSTLPDPLSVPSTFPSIQGEKSKTTTIHTARIDLLAEFDVTRWSYFFLGVSSLHRLDDVVIVLKRLLRFASSSLLCTLRALTALVDQKKKKVHVRAATLL